MSARLLTLVVSLLACSLLSGCLSDCSVSEASGVLSLYADTGCSSSGQIDSDGFRVEINPYGGADVKYIYQTIEFTAQGPFYVGKRVSADVTSGPRAAVFEEGIAATGQVDFIIDGVDYSQSYNKRLKLTIVDLSIRDLVTSAPGRFRGKLDLLQTGTMP